MLNSYRYNFLEFGTYTEALLFGGKITSVLTAKTEYWDGTSWTEIADLSLLDMVQNLSAGTASCTIIFFISWRTAPITTVTEEWTAPSVFSKQIEGQLFFNSTTNTFKETITDLPGATWASGGNLNTDRDAWRSRNTNSC